MAGRPDKAIALAALALLALSALWTVAPQALHARLIPNYCLEGLYAAWNAPELVRLFHHGPSATDLLSLARFNRGSSESAAGSLTYVLWIWPFFKTLGLGPLGFNVAAWGVNLALLVLAWRACRRLFNERMALAVPAVMAAVPWYRAIALSRNFFGVSALVALAACAMLLHAMQRRTRAGYLIAGLLVGLTVHGYVVGRVLLPVAPLYCLAAALGSLRRGPLDKQGLRLCAWLLLGMFLVMTPSLLDPGRATHELFTGDQESPFRQLAPDATPRPYSDVVHPLQNLHDLFAFPNFWFNGPLLHWAFLALLGLGALLIVIRRERNAGLFLAYGLAALAGIVLFAQWVTPSRIGGALVPLCFVAGRGLAGAAQLLERLLPRLRPWGAGLLAAAALFGLALPSGIEFNRNAAEPNPWQQAGRMIADQGLSTSVLLSTNKQFLRAGKIIYLELGRELSAEQAENLQDNLQPVEGTRLWRMDLPVRGSGPYNALLLIPPDEISPGLVERCREAGLKTSMLDGGTLLVRGAESEIQRLAAIAD